MNIFYSFLLFISFLFTLPLYFFRLKILRGESLFLRERLGIRLPGKAAGKKSLWIHAVSVGEVLSLQNLVKKIKERHPDWTVYFSTLTNTGMRVAREKLVEADHVFFIPLDFTCIVRRFFKTLEPKLFVLAESEFWPNLLREAHKQTRGVLVINGRISPRSFKRYSLLRFFAKRILKNIDLFLMQTEEDKKKLEQIGIHSEGIRVAGNLKCEISLPPLNDKDILALKTELNIAETKKVIVAGSTRKEEERKLMEAYAIARKIREDLVLILAPRHSERAEEVERICQRFPFPIVRKTKISTDTQWDVMILDTIGELAQFYALCDIAFIGGSLIPWGGQNLLEPAFYEKPIFFGPHMENFAFLAEKFIQAEAARTVYSENDLVEMFMIQDEKSLDEMGNRAKKTLNLLQGATERTLSAIETFMAEV
ncbi:MAG: 3-deoxy-D-manno-octulosonic acid transferase [Candidatus Aminicenantes bacterium]|nr:3-deoxy-D-manno-octulosonic acid transferase [Candidatus Aminicenantes bacterium]